MLKGRNITTDNLYTSVPLFDKMLVKGVTGIGTIRKKRDGLRKETKSDAGRENFSIVWYGKQKGKMKLILYAEERRMFRC